MEHPERLNAADYLVDKHIRAGRGSNLAVRCEDRSFTYADIQAGMNRFGNALQSSLDFRMEERVAMLMLDTEMFPQVLLGAIKIGAVPICLNTLMRPKDYLYFLNDSRARALIVDAALVESCIDPMRSELKYMKYMIVVNGSATKEGYLSYSELVNGQSTELATAPTTPDDSCFWLYSSGTTGNPKGTVHLQHDMLYCAEHYGKGVLGITENDTCFSIAKLFFAYGLGNNLIFPFYVGATAVYLPGRPDVKSVTDTIEKYQPTIFYAVPTMFGYILGQKEFTDLGRVRICPSAGEALSADVFHRWKERFGVEILDGIGSTEMLHIYVSNRIGQCRPGSTGIPVPGYSVRIVDDDFNNVEQGESGTLLIDGDSAAPYYWNKHEKTKSTMFGRWLNSGDKYFQDEDGYFYYAGRADDMLKVGGIWVSPIEVESCLSDHPAVLECAVVGAPDRENLIKPKAFVVLSEGHEPSPELGEDIKAFVKKSLAHYKFPRWIEFVEELPKTATGKIKRFELR